MTTTPTTITTLHEFYSIIATRYAAQEPRTKENIRCKCDRRKKGNNTTISFRYVHLTFNHKILPAEVYSLLAGKYCATLTQLYMVLSSFKEEPVPEAVTTASPVAVTMYEVYECLRNQLSTTAAYVPLHINGEAILPASLVMMLEDGDATLEARYEAERCPQPVAPAITKKASKYNRSEIATQAHYYAKVTVGGNYHQRFGKGMQHAWDDAKEAAGIVIETAKTPILEAVIKPVKIPALITYPSIFDYDILYYNPAYYAHYTEPKYFNSTRNHTLHY